MYVSMFFIRRVALARPGAPAIIQCQDNRSSRGHERPASHSGKSGGFMNITFSKLAENWREQGGLFVCELDPGGKTCRVLNLVGKEI